MELRVLKYFLMVAREENITRAAQLLHVTQPTLSRQLMQLEEELGVKLFRRSSHRIELTENGLLLKRRALEMAELEDKARQELSQQGSQLSGEVTLGMGEMRGVACIAGMLAAFRAQSPLVRFTLYSGSADHIKDRIEQGLLDAGVLFEPVDISKYGFVRMPHTEEWSVLLPKNHPLAAKSCVTPDDLLPLPLMLPSRSLVRQELARWFGDSFDHLDVPITFNLLNNAAIMVRQGLGVAVSAHLDVQYEDLVFRPLSPRIRASSVMVWKKNQVTSPATAALIHFARAYLGKCE